MYANARLLTNTCKSINRSSGVLKRIPPPTAENFKPKFYMPFCNVKRIWLWICNRRVKFPFKIAVVVEKRPQRDEKFDSDCMCKKMADGNNTCDLTAVGARRALRGPMPVMGRNVFDDNTFEAKARDLCPYGAENSSREPHPGWWANVSCNNLADKWSFPTLYANLTTCVMQHITATENGASWRGANAASVRTLGAGDASLSSFTRFSSATDRRHYLLSGRPSISRR